jgi:DNA polymerase-1
MDKAIEIRVEARSVFGPRKGYKMRSYDWKNIEVYIPGFKSKDPMLVKMLSAGEDVHEYTARSLTEIIGETIDREVGKRTFFGKEYGIGIEKNAKKLGISYEKAEQISDGFSNTYEGLLAWMHNLVAEARRDGYITTAYGRRICVDPDMAFRAVNYYVQGTAGGILKSAKVKIHNFLKENKWDAYIILPIHDELLIEYGPSVDVKKLDAMVVRFMQDNPELKMPVKIPVSISAIGDNWADKEKVRMAV